MQGREQESQAHPDDRKSLQDAKRAGLVALDVLGEQRVAEQGEAGTRAQQVPGAGAEAFSKLAISDFILQIPGIAARCFR